MDNYSSLDHNSLLNSPNTKFVKVPSKKSKLNKHEKLVSGLERKYNRMKDELESWSFDKG